MTSLVSCAEVGFIFIKEQDQGRSGSPSGIQNIINSIICSHYQHFLNISLKSAHNFSSYSTNKQIKGSQRITSSVEAINTTVVASDNVTNGVYLS